jgi:thioredoxin 1
MAQLKTRSDLSQLSRPAVVDIWAPWCGPCRSIRPTLATLAEQYNGKVDLIEVNADQQPDLVRQLGVRSIPTLLAVSGGKEVTRTIGAQPPARLAALFNAALTGQQPEPAGIPPMERLLRLGVGGALVALGVFSGPAWPLIVIGGVIGFLAVRDRCPIWQTLSPGLTRALNQLRAGGRPPSGR